MSNNRGISCLGLCHPKYPVKGLIKAFQNADMIRGRHLDNFFNAANSKHFIRMMRLPKQKFWTVIVINGPGMNNGRTQPHEITYRETTASVDKKVRNGNKQFLKKYEARLRALAAITALADAGTLEVAVNPWLEHGNISKQCFDKLAQIARQHFPGSRIIDNPVSGGLFPGYAHEKHGSGAPANIDIADLDGEDWEGVNLVAFGRKHIQAKACHIWGFRDNGMDGEESWKAPQNRHNWPRARDLAMYGCWVSPNALIEKRALLGSDVAGKTLHDAQDGWKRDFVWKLGDNRNYAICLLPRSLNGVNFTQVQVIKDGSIVSKGNRRGSYTEDGTNRQIWDFTKHTKDFPDNSVLVAGNHAWVLELPQFRID
jgi:hypothetical protein